MIAALIFGACLITASLIVVYGNKPRALEHRARRTAVVTCKSGAVFRGVLYQSDRQAVVLRNAETLAGDATVVVDGEALVLTADIDYIQFL